MLSIKVSLSVLQEADTKMGLNMHIRVLSGEGAYVKESREVPREGWEDHLTTISTKSSGNLPKLANKNLMSLWNGICLSITTVLSHWLEMHGKSPWRKQL